MKTHFRPQRAFTLIELITVIAIISILMALLFPALAAAREGARRAKAGTVVKDIVNACKNYALDYGKYPPVVAAKAGSGTNTYGSFGDITAGKCKVDNNQLFDILRGIAKGENALHVLNPRQQKYFDQTKATDIKNPRDGFVDGSEFPVGKVGQLMDPWGNEYCIVLDIDGDDVIDMNEFYTDLIAPDNSVRSGAVAFSMAKDGIRGGKGYPNLYRKTSSSQAPDDVVSW